MSVYVLIQLFLEDQVEVLINILIKNVPRIDTNVMHYSAWNSTCRMLLYQLFFIHINTTNYWNVS